MCIASTDLSERYESGKEFDKVFPSFLISLLGFLRDFLHDVPIVTKVPNDKRLVERK